MSALDNPLPRASAEKFPGGRWATEKRPKNSTINPLPGGGEQRKKIEK